VDETAYCWGRNDLGQLGRAETATSGVPAPVAGDHRFRRLAAGSRNVCGVTDVAVLCWGHGGLLDAPEPIREPTVVPLPPAAIMHVGVGLTHACALLAAGSVWCWGENTGGQRGDGTTLQSPAPTAVEGGHSFSALSVGTVHSCGRAAGNVWCWGLNVAVALGDGTSVDRAYILPEPVTLTFPATAVTAGPAFTCVLDASSRVLCAGARAARSWGKR
jgi:alpha-tubulin suppressor-like RCC1 family protein